MQKKEGTDGKKFVNQVMTGNGGRGDWTTRRELAAWVSAVGDGDRQVEGTQGLLTDLLLLQGGERQDYGK